jgi:hypothetical protein
MSTFAYFSICRRSVTILNVGVRRQPKMSSIADMKRHRTGPHFLHVCQYLKLGFGGVWISLNLLIDKLSRGCFRFPKGETGASRRAQETWPWPVQRNSLPTTRCPVGAADGHAAASALAKALAGKSDHSDFVGEHDYWWGHDRDIPQLYRYVIRPV